MKKEIKQEIKIPENIKININGKTWEVEGPLGRVKKELNFDKILVKKEENRILIQYKNATKKEKRIIKTNLAHIKNMIRGVQEKFQYKLKICFNHFPFTLKIEENKAIIKNFLGEKKERIIEMPKDVEIKIDKEIIIISSINKECAGQAAANLERITRIKGRDKRIFQDGIYIINKNGKDI